MEDSNAWLDCEFEISWGGVEETTASVYVEVHRGGARLQREAANSCVSSPGVRLTLALLQSGCMLLPPIKLNSQAI
jgi:hypothetical protein